MNQEYNTPTGAAVIGQNHSTSQPHEVSDTGVGRFQILDFHRKAIVIPVFAIHAGVHGAETPVTLEHKKE